MGRRVAQGREVKWHRFFGACNAEFVRCGMRTSIRDEDVVGLLQLILCHLYTTTVSR